MKIKYNLFFSTLLIMWGTTFGTTDVFAAYAPYTYPTYTQGSSIGTVNETNTSPKTAKCDPGYYLPANSSSCKTCKDRYYVCVGGTFPVKNTNDQGIKKCNSGLVADEFKTQCIKQGSTQNQPSKISAKCTIGQYLPKNSTTCKSCNSLGSKYYCPENTIFSNAPYTDDKGIKSCSPWEVANNERTSCVYITQKCDPGKYLKRSNNGVSCESCPSDSRYYCPGGTISSALPDAGLKTCPSAKIANKEHSACVYKSINLDPGQYLPKNSLTPIKCSDNIRYYCPGGIVTSGPSDSGLFKCKSGMVADESHKTCITEEKPIKTEKCNPGDYLPKNTATCKTCKDRYYICIGGDYPINTPKDQGLTKCDSGKIPNDNHTVCIDEPPTEVYCAPGTYLPRNGKTEKDCASAKCLSAKYYFCPGGTYTVSPFDQGLDFCDDNQQANEEHTACNNLDPAMIHVPSGYYLPANTEIPEECPSGTNKYCVGGGFFKSGMVQGIKDCPMNTKTNEKKDGCMMSFSAEQMKRNKTNDECWLKKTSEEYKKCVFGK